MTTTPASNSAPAEPDACLHFDALFPDTQLHIVLSPGLGRRMRRLRAGLARLVRGRDGAPTSPGTPDVPTRCPAELPEEKGAAR